MRSFFVCLRIILVGVLWGIVFTEGIRVIMLCNWHFDIFWPDHWRQAKELWQAGWVVRAPKEWAFVIILATFFPMLITGWWTLSLVAWERIIYQILLLPVNLYRYFIKKPINVITTNNKYGVVKRKSYKQIRPTGIIGSIRSPISDYNDSSRSSATTAAATSYTPATTPSYAASSGTSSYIGSAYNNNSTKPAVKTDVSATIDHALFKFDDDDDDFDLDIDSFEKTDISKKRAADSKPKQSNKRKLEDAFADDFDEDDFDDAPVKNKRDNRRNKAKVEDDEDEFETPSRRGSRAEKSDERERRGKDRNKEDKDGAKSNKRGNKNNRDESGEDNVAPAKKDNAHGPVYDALQQKGYNIINNIAVGDATIDFVAVDENKICLCMVDKENGDWLADEELFNGEEPLWFSESSHRVSPVRKLKIARDTIKEKLQEEGFEQNLQAYVVVQMANIINADDMFDIWDDMDIKVTRINRGAPKEIQLFSKTLGEAEGSLPRQDMDKLRKTLKSLKQG